MTTSIVAWSGFLLFICALLALDLGVFHKLEHRVSPKEAAITTGIWVGLAFAFNAGIWYFLGKAPALQFLTGYLIEYSLSVDNIFVFIMLFTYFQVPDLYRHRVLFWGILGALILRATLIGVGTALIHAFHWVLYLFGAFLVVSAIKMATGDDEGVEPDKNPVIGLARKLFPISDQYSGAHLFARENGRMVATPLFLVLLVVETTDVMFALDSIPAIFAISTDSFIVFTSNIFAILGLRSLYFLLDGVMGLFRFLKYGLSVVLGFIGLKMLLSNWIEIGTAESLLVVTGILGIAIIASLLFPERSGERAGASSKQDKKQNDEKKNPA